MLITGVCFYTWSRSNFFSEAMFSFGCCIDSVFIEKAKVLLLHQNIPTEHIAEAVGYHDINSFYRAFRSFTGSTPKQWKQQNRE